MTTGGYFNICRTLRILMFILLLPLINIIVSTYETYDDIQSINHDYLENISNVNESRWVFINGILEENRDKAKLQAIQVREKIEYRLLDTYKFDMIRLKLDLNTDVDNPAFEIMNQEISGKYLNVDNDNNDMFVATNKRVIVDKSINCAIGKKTRSWEEEISMHSNKKLAAESIKMLLNKSNTDIIFWKFLPDDDLEYQDISSPSIKELKRVYDQYGVYGLKAYEFLVPDYIRKDIDIFNVQDVNMHGIKNDNDKLIVVQGFNLYDALNLKYKDKLLYFENLENQAKRDMDMKKQERIRWLVFNISFMISSFIGIFAVAKTVINWGGDDVIGGCKG